MDAVQALADLTEISSEVVQVVIVDRDGSILATTVGDQQRAERLVAAITRLLAEAERSHGRAGSASSPSSKPRPSREASLRRAATGG